jgi:transcriptional regulator with XRE-family HTH domain
VLYEKAFGCRFPHQADDLLHILFRVSGHKRRLAHQIGTCNTFVTPAWAASHFNVWDCLAVNLKVFGRRLNAIRKAKGLSLQTLADDSGVAKNSIGPIENGKGNPQIETLKDLAETLGAPFALYIGEPPTGEAPSFSAAADFLARFEDLEPVFQRMVLTLIYKDARYTSGIHVPAGAQAEIHKLFGPLLKARS